VSTFLFWYLFIGVITLVGLLIIGFAAPLEFMRTWEDMIHKMTGKKPKPKDLMDPSPANGKDFLAMVFLWPAIYVLVIGAFFKKKPPSV